MWHRSLVHPKLERLLTAYSSNYWICTFFSPAHSIQIGSGWLPVMEDNTWTTSNENADLVEGYGVSAYLGLKINKGSSQKKIKEGVVCIFVVFLTTSRIFCLRKGGGRGSPLFPTWLDFLLSHFVQCVKVQCGHIGSFMLGLTKKWKKTLWRIVSCYVHTEMRI